jgi:hypothetical protein
VMARAPGRHALGVTLNRLMDALDAEKPASGVQLSLDVDPYTFL